MPKSNDGFINIEKDEDYNGQEDSSGVFPRAVEANSSNSLVNHEESKDGDKTEVQDFTKTGGGMIIRDGNVD